MPFLIQKVFFFASSPSRTRTITCAVRKCTARIVKSILIRLKHVFGQLSGSNSAQSGEPQNRLFDHTLASVVFTFA